MLGGSMYKVIVIISSLFIFGCSTNPPSAPLPSGWWIQMNTHVAAAKLQKQKQKELNEKAGK
ncbi:hypothetical protein JV34_22515 [Pectobacterium atrosepticum]|nr:hypothetical protein JV34_22515 [Pectobacterium atrosepticum]